TAAAHRRGHGGNVGLVAIGADADRDHLREVHAVQRLDEAPDEMTPALLAVGDDVDARALLLAEGEDHRGAPPLRRGAEAPRVALPPLEARALPPPGGPEGPGRRQPCRFGQASRDRGFEHRAAWYHAAMIRLVALTSVVALALSLGACSLDPEKQWYKPNGNYTSADFDRDSKACTKD